jgi:chromosome partitioning protein
MPKNSGPVSVCVINMKGGVGKSTVSALLARRAFSDRQLDVLAIDLDPQANLSQALMHERYGSFLKNKAPSIVELFNGYVPPSVKHGSPSPLSVSNIVQRVARSTGRSLELIPARFDFSDNLINAVKPNPRVLAQFLSANFHDKDFIIIDCAPTESIFTHAAYHATSNVLVPVKPEYFATIGFPLLQSSLSDFRSHNKSHDIDVCGVVINNAFYDGGNNGGPEKERAIDEIQAEANSNGWKIYDNEIPHSRGFPKMMRGDYNYLGNATQFYLFADEFFGSVGL